MLPNYANSYIIVACYIRCTVSGLPHCVVWAVEAAGKERKQPHQHLIRVDCKNNYPMDNQTASDRQRAILRAFWPVQRLLMECFAASGRGWPSYARTHTYTTQQSEKSVSLKNCLVLKSLICTFFLAHMKLHSGSSPKDTVMEICKDTFSAPEVRHAENCNYLSGILRLLH